MSYREQLSKLVKSDPFWGDQPSILYASNRVVEFVPTTDMNRVEKINALTRMFIYLGLILTLVYQKIIYLYIPIVGMLFLYFVHINYPEHEREEFAADCDACSEDDNGNLYEKPTKDNPFMNVLLTDYVDDPTRAPAADIEDPNIRKDIKKMFDHGLYKNANDIWDKNNSQRQYYTNPSTTIPNDRDSFMKWCWKVPYVCKDGDLVDCLKYDDVRAHGQII